MRRSRELLESNAMNEPRYRQPIGPTAASLPRQNGSYDADKLITEFDRQFQQGLAAFQRGESDEKYGLRAILDQYNPFPRE